MLNLMIAYYATGWVTQAANFALLRESARAPLMMSLLLPFVVLPLVLLFASCDWIERLGSGARPQYFWRRP